MQRQTAVTANFSRKQLMCVFCIEVLQQNTRHLANVAVMVGKRRRRWPNTRATFDQCLVFAGVVSVVLITVPLKRVITSERQHCYGWCYFPSSYGNK